MHSGVRKSKSIRVDQIIYAARREGRDYMRGTYISDQIPVKANGEK